MKRRLNYYPVKLVLGQLIDLGFHIGHTRKVSLFLNAWVIYGYRNKYAVLQMRKSLLSFYQMHHIITVGMKLRRPFWFTCFDDNYMGYVTRYALLTGQALSINNWIFGSLSNFKNIFRRGNFLSYLSLDYNFKKREQKFINRFSGLLRTKGKVPFAVFIVRLNEMGVKVSRECGSAKVISCGVVDSDIHGESLFLPVPGNDDSLVCVIFFLRYIANIILFKNVTNMKMWKRKVLKYNNNKKEEFKASFFALLMKKKKVNYEQFLRAYYKHYFFLDKISSSWSTKDRLNLSSATSDLSYVYIDTLLPRKEKYRSHIYYL